MAFDNSVTNSQPPKSETPNVDKLPDHVKEQARDAGRPSLELIDRSQKAHENHARKMSAGEGDAREALRVDQGAHGQEQEKMSPTDKSRSQTHHQARHHRGRSIGH